MASYARREQRARMTSGATPTRRAENHREENNVEHGNR
jgi:hypothetical protein